MAPLRKRTPYKKRTYTKRKARPAQSWSSMAITALSGYALNKLKSKLGLNTEKHWLDTIETNLGTSSTCTPMAYPLTIPQGDTVNTRSGSSCRLTSYTCKIRLQANAAATTPCYVRIMFVKFKETRGASPTASFFLDSSTRITSQYQMGDSANASGYSILFDRTIPINIITSDDSTKMINFKYTPLVHHLKWDSTDTTGNAANLSDGFIRGFIFTSETGANTPNYWADHRVKFVDN